MKFMDVVLHQELRIKAWRVVFNFLSDCYILKFVVFNFSLDYYIFKFVFYLIYCLNLVFIIFKMYETLKKIETGYPVPEPVPGGSGTGSKIWRTGVGGSGSGSFIPGTAGSGSGSGSMKNRRVPSYTHP